MDSRRDKEDQANRLLLPENLAGEAPPLIIGSQTDIRQPSSSFNAGQQQQSSQQQASPERYVPRKREKRRTQLKKTTQIITNAFKKEVDQALTSQIGNQQLLQQGNGESSPLQNGSQNQQQQHHGTIIGGGGGSISSKLLTKHQNIQEKQKKLMEVFLKNQENSVVSKSAAASFLFQKQNMIANANNARGSKTLNQNFIVTLKQKIQEVEEQEKQTFRYKFNAAFSHCKIKTMNIILNKYVEIFMGIATIFTLFSEDLRQVLISDSNDLYYQIVELVVLVLFFFEIVILSICKKGYFLRFNFWMDIVSTVSMLFDIDFLTKAIFGFSINYNQVNVLKASRVSRIATRATKLVRFIRLLRLTKLQTLYKKAYEKLHVLYVQKDELSEQSEHSIMKDKRLHSNTSSQQIETDRLNHSINGLHSEFQFKLKKDESKENKNEYLATDHHNHLPQQFRRMNSFEKNSSSKLNNACQYRRRSFEDKVKEKESPLRSDLINTNLHLKTQKKESNAYIDSGELSNQVLSTVQNNQQISPSAKKLDLGRKSEISHISHMTATSHESQFKQNLFLSQKRVRASCSPAYFQNNLKSISFVNPGLDTPKRIISQNELEENNDDDTKSRSSFGSQNSFGFEEIDPLQEDPNKQPSDKAIDLNKKRINEESKIGQQLANKIINRVILMIFTLVICIPLFDVDYYMTTDIGFDTLLQFLRDQYDEGDTLYPLLLQIMVNTGKSFDSSDVMHRYPLFEFIAADQIVYPSQNYPLNNIQFNDLRDDEKQDFSYSSLKDNKVFESLYIIKLDQDLASYLSITQTAFIMVLLAYSIIIFVRDINKLVVSPIERMLQNIKQIADNPLQAAKLSEEKAMAEQELKKNRVQYLELAEKQGDETYLLESTIMKIGALLAIGFGEAGSKIITKNMQKGGRIDPMIPGKKIMAIFGFCSIKNFADATEILQEKVMIFANEIAELVHICCDSFHGAINKNLGDCFLLVWKFTEDESQLFIDEYDEVRMKNLPLVQNLSDLPLIAFLKAIANSRLLSLTPNFIQQHLTPLKKQIPSFKLRLGFGLHVGWGIEGAIGSHFKIDASYLSPNVNLASRLENATKQYGLYLLLSGSLYRLLSPKAQNALRHIDRVTVKGSKQPMDLYTCDVDPTLLKEGKYIQKRPSDANVNKKVLKFISRKRRTERYRRIIKGQAHICQILDSDQDIFTMRQHFTDEFRDTYHEGLQEYFEGDWLAAREIFEEAQLILRENLQRVGEDISYQDGPIRNLISFMGKTNFKAPRNWYGYRVLYDK